MFTLHPQCRVPVVNIDLAYTEDYFWGQLKDAKGDGHVSFSCGRVEKKLKKIDLVVLFLPRQKQNLSCFAFCEKITNFTLEG